MPEDGFSRALSACCSWPVENVSAAVTDCRAPIAAIGDGSRIYRLASLSKAFTAWACLVAVEEGSVSLEDTVGPPGATLRHCLAHAAGLPFDGREPLAGVGTRRIYSNAGIEIASEHVAERSGIPFVDYLNDAVFRPLGLERTSLQGSSAHGVRSCVDDVCAFAREILAPTLISTETARDACRVQFPELAGVVPGFGQFDPNPWGLGLEIHGVKSPHWMGTRTSPFAVGHFGGAGTMFWVDPDIGLSLVALTDRPFDEWADIARIQWSTLSDAIVSAGETR